MTNNVAALHTLSIIYHGIANAGYGWKKPFREWQKNIIIIFPTKRGGIVVEKVERVGWVHVYTPGCFPRPKSWRGMIAAVAATGAVDFLAARPIPATEGFLQKAGFQKITESKYNPIYSIKLR